MKSFKEFTKNIKPLVAGYASNGTTFGHYKDIDTDSDNLDDIPVGHFSISNRPEVIIDNNLGESIQESIYDLSPSLSEFEKEPYKFNYRYNKDPYLENSIKAVGLNTTLEDHYHSGFNKERKHDDFSEYTNGSGGINTFLIDRHLGKPDDDDYVHYKVNTIRALDDHFNNYSKPAPKDFHVYTGVGGKLDIHSLRQNRSNRLYLPAYTSTSIKAQVASTFASRYSFDVNGNVPTKKYREVVRLHIPEGSNHGIYLGSTGLNMLGGHEHEFLIDRGHIIQFMGEPRMSNNGDNVLVHDAKIIRQVKKPIYLK